MKRISLVILVVTIIVLSTAGPAIAASLGISPPRVELEVPADSSAIVDFKVHYFSGDIQVSLIDIPLRVEPATLHIEAGDEPVPVQLKIYGDPSLGSKRYTGYVRFTGGSSGMVDVAIQARATITNLVDGQPVEDTQADTLAPEDDTAVELTEPAPQSAEETAQITVPVDTTDDSGVLGGMSTNMVILIAGGLVFVGLIVLAVVILMRRRY